MQLRCIVVEHQSPMFDYLFFSFVFHVALSLIEDVAGK